MSDNKDLLSSDEPYLGLEIETTPLTLAQAESLTKSIRDAAEVIWVLIARAHKGQAWKALGYESWADYVKTEFDMSRSRSYQLLDQAKVIAAIKDATPEGTDINVTESAARELKYVIQEAVPEIKEKTAGLEPEEAVRVTQEILAKYEAARQGTSEEAAAAEEEDYAQIMSAAPDLRTETSVSDSGSVQEPVHSTSTPEAEEINEEKEPVKSESVQPTTPKLANEELAEIRKNVNAAHDIYSALSALASLPNSLDKVIGIIPAERQTIVNTNLPVAISNLQNFADLWNSKENGTNNHPKETTADSEAIE